MKSIHWPGAYGGFDYEASVAGHEESVDFIADALRPVFDAFDVISDVPVPVIYERLHQMYPGALFIALYRNPFSWIKSVRKHVGEREFYPLEKAQYWRYVPGNPKTITQISDLQLLSMYLGHYACLIKYFDGNDNFFIGDLERLDVGDLMSKYLDLPPISMNKVDNVVAPSWKSTVPSRELIREISRRVSAKIRSNPKT